MEKDDSFIDPKEKDEAILGALRSRVKTIGEVGERVDKITSWIDEQQKKLLQNSEHKAFLWLDFDYANSIQLITVDTILKILGTRLLTESERLDAQKQIEIGIKSTNKPNVYLYAEITRKNHNAPLKERYGLLVSEIMELPATISGIGIKEEKIEEKPEKVVKMEEVIEAKAVEADPEEIKVKEEVKPRVEEPKKPEPVEEIKPPTEVKAAEEVKPVEAKEEKVEEKEVKPVEAEVKEKELAPEKKIEAIFSEKILPQPPKETKIPKKWFFGRRFFEKPVVKPPEQIPVSAKKPTIFDYLDRIILGDEEEEEEE
jgi:hypothetical protein